MAISFKEKWYSFFLLVTDYNFWLKGTPDRLLLLLLCMNGSDSSMSMSVINLANLTLAGLTVPGVQ